MFTKAIWIKAIALIIVGAAVVAISIYQIKKQNQTKMKIEFYIAILLSLVIIIAGGINATRAVNPHYETISASYVYQSNNEIFGKQYNFKDYNGEIVTLSMDPITYRHIFKGKSFEKNKAYTITFDSKSKTIVGIK